MAVIEEIVEEKTTPAIEKKEGQSKPVENEEVKKDTTELDQDGDLFYDSTEYQPEELEKLVKEASTYKDNGNTFFGQGEYPLAILEYENALLTCPLSHYKERSIYFGNIAACHLKQKEFKEARDMCTQSLKLDPSYTKALLRRAQANEKLGTSSSMSDALADYNKLKPLVTDSYTLRECNRADRELPNQIKAKQEQEKDEMVGKLKDLGNTLLGKFGLSTDNFQMTPDPSGSGGYSMNFVNK